VRPAFLLVLLVLAAIAPPGGEAFASDPGPTLVLPLRTFGVSDTTAAVVTDLLRGALEARGVAVVAASRQGADLAGTEAACEDADCATAAARRHGASRVVYGSLSRLGNKIIVGIRALRPGDATPDYADQIAANSEEDLDAVVRRIADTLAAGRPNADQVKLDTVTEAETLEPRRRASRTGAGLRAGFLFPVADSYGGLDRLTSVRLAFKYETPSVLIETTPVLGFAWRGDTVEWTMLDVFAARILGAGDFAPYVGVGLGVHSLRLEKAVSSYTVGGTVYTLGGTQSENTLTADAGVGLLALRTYDFLVVLDLRYHYVFSDFGNLGGDGAHGIAITFGTSR
jgi:hypothetical protein